MLLDIQFSQCAVCFYHVPGGNAKSAALHLMPDLLHLYGMCCTAVILTFYYDQQLEPVPGIDQYMKPFWPLLLADLLGITGVLLRFCSHYCSTPIRPDAPVAAVPIRQLKGIAGPPPYHLEPLPSSSHMTAAPTVSTYTKLPPIGQGQRLDQMHLVGEGDAQALGTSAARTSVTTKGPVCDYQLACLRFKNSLGIGESYFSHEQDKCFCETCHKARGDDDYYTRGEPKKKYAMPVGWTRFGLSLNPTFKDSELNVFDNWHRAYHGTDSGVVKKILQNSSQLLMAGDVALGGRKLGEREGHFNPDRKPEGFDTTQLFVTPSIVYAGLDAYASPKKFEADGKKYNARVAFQLCIRPDSYKVGPETVGARGKGITIDPLFKNEELEWSTKERGGTALYGLLVKLEPFVEGSDDADVDELRAELRLIEMLFLLGALGILDDDDSDDE
ncbi:NEURL4 [Branchiostoma lanceolatum]|uniref:NEURL4 protein n=1 Tax=Branchiostoma lanceolatum TaxID=7740 RepID=A0A8J9ZA99_BRALA|nr:NEURL4 [Branchiostoma lanceolatum]